MSESERSFEVRLKLTWGCTTIAAAEADDMRAVMANVLTQTARKMEASHDASWTFGTIEVLNRVGEMPTTETVAYSWNVDLTIGD